MAVATEPKALEPSRLNHKTIELKQSGAALDVSYTCVKVLHVPCLTDSSSSSSPSRESQEFVDKFEGALGKGKGRKWYAYKVKMKKVRVVKQHFILPCCFLLLGLCDL